MAAENEMSNYHDFFSDGDAAESLFTRENGREHASTRDSTFPEKLHYMLSQLETEGSSHIVSWQPQGLSFIVYDREIFAKHMLPSWFRRAYYASFVRQLNLYGFQLITDGPDKGGYYHELFLRGKFHLCRYIRPTQIKGRKREKLNPKRRCQPDIFAGQDNSRPDPDGSCCLVPDSYKSTSYANHKERDLSPHDKPEAASCVSFSDVRVNVGGSSIESAAACFMFCAPPPQGTLVSQSLDIIQLEHQFVPGSSVGHTKQHCEKNAVSQGRLQRSFVSSEGLASGGALLKIQEDQPRRGIDFTVSTLSQLSHDDQGEGIVGDDCASIAVEYLRAPGPAVVNVTRMVENLNI